MHGFPPSQVRFFARQRTHAFSVRPAFVSDCGSPRAMIHTPYLAASSSPSPIDHLHYFHLASSFLANERFLSCRSNQCWSRNKRREGKQKIVYSACHHIRSHPSLTAVPRAGNGLCSTSKRGDRRAPRALFDTIGEAETAPRSGSGMIVSSTTS